ncbi:CVNH domain-containing protein [Rhizoctonia solani AG-1 IA]|uniref:CVNH domain-containing protein n=1 Tax=Thanatephorus cucumeris (strain AG1-IA) TaxID=983506 RepID=L8WWD6_THACA|nr:CVNH domain-containing protein [Rhizoctonia solani AG-1 IA]
MKYPRAVQILQPGQYPTNLGPDGTCSIRTAVIRERSEIPMVPKSQPVDIYALLGLSDHSENRGYCRALTNHSGSGRGMLITAACEKFSISHSALYDLSLFQTGESDWILRAKITKEGKRYIADDEDLDEKLGDDTVNLSAILGNKDGHFEWGSSAFDKSAVNISLKGRKLVADLQDRTGAFRSNVEVDLDSHLDICEYSDEQNMEKTRYRFTVTQLPPPRVELWCCALMERRITSVIRIPTSLNLWSFCTKMILVAKGLVSGHHTNSSQTGVGTYTPSGVDVKQGGRLSQEMDKAVACVIRLQVIDGYRYLMETYQAGDRICLFGFSRGAFTARALAGMIHSDGAWKSLPNQNDGSEVEEKVADGALSMTDGIEDPDQVKPEDFKQTFSAIWPKTLPWIDYNPSIRHFRNVYRQALALDENRGNFSPSLWTHARTNTNNQTAYEVWFRGEHSDIGGGADYPTPPHETFKQSMLSNIPLRWMIRQFMDSAVKSGIILDAKAVERYRTKGVLERVPNPDDPTPWSNYEAERRKLADEADQRDICHQIYDSRGETFSWKRLGYGLLELAPFKKRIQTTDGYTEKRGWNFWKSRTVFLPPGPYPVNLHASVLAFQASLLAQKLAEYKPRATIEYVDSRGKKLSEERYEGSKAHESPSSESTLSKAYNKVASGVSSGVSRLKSFFRRG